MASGSDLNLGKIGMSDKGDYVQGTSYGYLEAVTYDNRYWISKEDDNSTTPSASNPKWHLALDGKTASELPPPATESNVRAIVSGYTPSN